MVTAPYDLPRSWAWSALGPIFLYDAGSKRELNTLDQSRWLLEPEDVEKATGRLVTRVRASERASQSMSLVIDSRRLLEAVLQEALAPAMEKTA